VPRSTGQSPLSGSSKSPAEVQISTLIVDGSELIGRALAALLEGAKCYEVVAFARDLADARRYANGHKPQLVVLGPYAPASGDSTQGHSEAIASIREVSPKSRCVMVTDSFFGTTEIAAGLDAGADGVVSVDTSVEAFLNALSDVAGGEAHVSPRLALELVRAARVQAADEISARETEVLRLIALGHTNAEIAQELTLSIRTIESHRANIQAKLGAGSRAELVRYALDHALLA
jgi:two-component system, NarL family, response regulator NreC